jgi:hypothetical protein
VRRADKRAVRFVRAVPGGAARREGEVFVAGDPPVSLGGEAVRALISAGVLAGDNETCRASAEARGWLRRTLVEEDPFAGQHRTESRMADGTRLNLSESPLARLAVAAEGEAPFLARHQVEAGERVRKLCERAQLQPRVTMSYSAAHTAGGKGVSRAAELTDMAAAARRELAGLHRVLPADCAGVVLDVCGLLKGLQVVEAERGWPRRSAKLVLRIGLEQLAQHFGLAPVAVGGEARMRGWGERPGVVG